MTTLIVILSVAVTAVAVLVARLIVVALRAIKRAVHQPEPHPPVMAAHLTGLDVTNGVYRPVQVDEQGRLKASEPLDAHDETEAKKRQEMADYIARIEREADALKRQNDELKDALIAAGGRRRKRHESSSFIAIHEGDRVSKWPVLALGRLEQARLVKAGTVCPNVLFDSIHFQYPPGDSLVHKIGDWPVRNCQLVSLAGLYMGVLDVTPPEDERARYLQGSVVLSINDGFLEEKGRAVVESSIVDGIGFGPPPEEAEPLSRYYVAGHEDRVVVIWGNGWTPKRDTVIVCGFMSYLVGVDGGTDAQAIATASRVSV